jgi:hypothetical protein
MRKKKGVVVIALAVAEAVMVVEKKDMVKALSQILFHAMENPRCLANK